jgi:lysophospholipase L1-like esterase
MSMLTNCLKCFLVFILLCSCSFYLNAQHSTYYYQKKTLHEQLPAIKKGIVLLGDSITDGCEWNELFKSKKVQNRGISGDVTQGVLDRLDDILKHRPKKIYLMIGVNDLARGKSVEYVIDNIKKIAQKVHTNAPKTKLYIQSILPVNIAFDKFKNHTNKTNEILQINKAIANLAGKTFTYINLYDAFTDANGQLDKKYSNDGLHLNGSGYLNWKKYIKL